MNNETIESFEEEGILNIEKVINGYNAYIYKILQNSISNELDIEEILSDVFVIFWKKYKELDKRTKVKPYLAGITKNLIKEKSKIISKTLANIKEIDKDIFIMFYYKQKKIKDIARIFKISETKVKVILHRVRKSIKKNLKERGYNYGK